jgi:hypothetical protein
LKEGILMIRQIVLAMTVALIFSFSASAQLPLAEKTYVNSTLSPATALLYSQSAAGSMDMRCTATAIDQDDTSYTFVTAAHCGCTDSPERNRVTPQKTFFFISPDIVGDKIYLKATPKGCGYRTKGDDFFLLTVDKSFKFPVIPLGKDPKLLDEIINVGGPLGMGKQVFLGSVSSPSVDRPIADGEIQWTNAVLLQEFGVAPGSSGSSVVCIDQHAICAFVVGSVAESTMVAMPVSRFLKFREQLVGGKYKWYQADPDAPDARPEDTGHGK